jgi:hypothetical protein
MSHYVVSYVRCYFTFNCMEMTTGSEFNVEKCINIHKGHSKITIVKI